MLKKHLIFSSQVLALAAAVVLILPSSALALTIQLNDRGGATFYQDQVLGDEVEKPEADQKPEAKVESIEKARPERPETKDQESVRKQSDEVKFEKLEPKVRPTSKPESKPELREIKQNEKRKIEIKPAKERLEINLKTESKFGKLEKTETMESATIKVKPPKSESSPEIEREFELHQDESGTEMKISASGVEAKTAAKFKVDPVTNQVTLTTPSGQEHELKHLPDEALKAMTDKSEGDQLASGSGKKTLPEPKIELKENSQGKVVYQATIQEEKKFLGLFNWTKLKTLELNDQTGEVTDASAAAPVASDVSVQAQWFNWFRDRLSR